jgi:hypothetical protein
VTFIPTNPEQPVMRIMVNFTLIMLVGQRFYKLCPVIFSEIFWGCGIFSLNRLTQQPSFTLS